MEKTEVSTYKINPIQTWEAWQELKNSLIKKANEGSSYDGESKGILEALNEMVKIEERTGDSEG